LLDFGSNNRVMNYYKSDGRKVFSKTMRTDGTSKTLYYSDVCTYEKLNSAYQQVKYIAMPEGRIVNNGTDAAPDFSLEYNLKDHLGNVRAVIEPTSTPGYANVLQQTHYFPFGMLERSVNPALAGRMSEICTTSGTDNDYLYNGKELQEDFGLNWYDYGARFYDPALGRFHSVDPHAENYVGCSPYHYVANNPMLLTDPTGMDWYSYTDDDGNEHYKYQDGSDKSIDVDGNTYSNIGSSVSININDDVYLNAFQNLTIQSFGEAVDLKRKILNDRGLFLDYIKDGSDLSMQGRVELFTSHVSKAMGEDGSKVMMGIAAVTGGVIGAGELAAVLPMMGEAAMNQLALMEYNSAFVSSNLALPYNASIAAGTLFNHTQTGQWIMSGILAQAPFGLQSGFNIPQQKMVIMEWLQKSFQLSKANKKNK
jgi:RHS repeat-associated protein